MTERPRSSPITVSAGSSETPDTPEAPDTQAATDGSAQAAPSTRVGMWYLDHLEIPLPQRHRYPRQKYRMVRERLLAEGDFLPGQFHPAEPEAWELLELLHTPAYLAAVRGGTLTPQAIRELGLPFSQQLVQRARAGVNGTLSGTLHALRHGVAANLGGGNHHGFPDRGTGYCLFNDIAVTIRYLRHHGTTGRILIVDLDVHQGNANAAIFAQDETVFTFSAHGAKNWPYRKEVSDLDLPLADGTEDEAYLDQVEGPLAETFLRFQPELVFYQAGADPLHSDQLGRLALTVEGLRRRDRMVYGLVAAQGCPLMVTLGGGYGRPIEETVEAHLNTVRELAHLPAKISGDKP